MDATKFFVFEGLDLSGKSTAIEKVCQKLKNKEYNVEINNGALGADDVLRGKIEDSMSHFEKGLYYTYLLTLDNQLPIKEY